MASREMVVAAIARTLDQAEGSLSRPWRVTLTGGDKKLLMDMTVTDSREGPNHREAKMNIETVPWDDFVPPCHMSIVGGNGESVAVDIQVGPEEAEYRQDAGQV